MTSICGMAVATAAIICVLSVFNGFRAVIAGRLDTLSPDVLVTPAKGKTIADGEETAARILAVEGVERATPTISDNALALYGGREMPVLLKGVDPEAYSEITSVRSLIIPDHSGRFLKNGAAKAEGTLSIGVASQLGVFPGDGFLIFAPRREGRVNLANPLASFITDSITASGVFRTDQTEYDTDHLIVDLATAEIDLKNPKTNRKNAGFTDQEREKFTALLNAGFTDTFRHFYPDTEGAYSWWSYRFKAREKNAGWRIDYFVVSDSLKDSLKDACIYKDIMGSDHCPVGLTLAL